MISLNPHNSPQGETNHDAYLIDRETECRGPDHTAGSIRAYVLSHSALVGASSVNTILPLRTVIITRASGYIDRSAHHQLLLILEVLTCFLHNLPDSYLHPLTSCHNLFILSFSCIFCITSSVCLLFSGRALRTGAYPIYLYLQCLAYRHTVGAQ